MIGAVEATCDAIKPGMTAGEVCAVADRWLTESEFVSSIPEMNSMRFVGHGLGLMWEAPWLTQDNPAPIEPNMYLAVEVLLGHPSLGGAEFEQNGIVTEHGFEVLTSARSRWW